MSARVELANPHLYATPQEYVEKHLVPTVTELQRLINELAAPGSASAEDGSVDMVPAKTERFVFRSLDKRLEEKPKHVVFDGAEYLSVSKELLRQKQLKVQLSATVYALGKGDVEFRLVRDDDVIILGSTFIVDCRTPTMFTHTLPFGNSQGCVAPEQRSYIMQARCIDGAAIPVCRRFSMSFVYI